MKKLIITLVCLLFIVTMAGCGNRDDIINSPAEKMQNLYGENKEITEDCDMSLGAVCSNGIFVGCENEGVISYKGIPYAKSPIGSLRWKPAEEPDSSDKVYEAYYYGKSPIQTEWPSEVGSYYEQWPALLQWQLLYLCCCAAHFQIHLSGSHYGRRQGAVCCATGILLHKGRYGFSLLVH